MTSSTTRAFMAKKPFATASAFMAKTNQLFSTIARLRLLLVMFLTLSVSAEVWGAEVTTTLSQSIIYSTGSAGTGYNSHTFTVDGKTWNAYAIKNYHSKATNSQHFLQIRKYGSNTAYYIQVPNMPGNITSITMIVSSTQKQMDGGGNNATLYFSSQNSTSSTGDGVASGTGTNSITIDCSSLNLTSGYITASAGIRIWDVAVTYETAAATKLATPTNLKVSNVTTTSATLSWDAVTNASGYTVTVGSTPYSANTNSISLNSLTPSTTYKWSVVAKGNGSTYTDSESAKGSDFTTDTPQKYTVTWMVDKETLSTEDVYEDGKVSSVPTVNELPCGDKFVGWTTAPIATPQNEAPDVFTTVAGSPKITKTTTFYAVFADYEQ